MSQTLLIHLDRAEKAFEEMTHIAKPGRLVVCREPDNVSVLLQKQYWSLDDLDIDICLRPICRRPGIQGCHWLGNTTLGEKTRERPSLNLGAFLKGGVTRRWCLGISDAGAVNKVPWLLRLEANGLVPAILTFAMGVLLIAVAGVGSLHAQCVDCGDYLHWVGGMDTPGEACDVAVVGDYAYVADYGSGLQVIDISTLTSPRIVGSVSTPDIALGVAAMGGYAYVADYGWSGLQVVDIRNASSPQIVGGVDMPGLASGVAVSGGYAYVADGWSGLQIAPGQCEAPLDQDPPSLTISVHQNPELTSELEIYLVASEPLQARSVWLAVDTTEVAVVPSDATKSIYTCSYHLSSSGTMTIDARARDLAGNQADTSRTFGAGLIEHGRGGGAASPQGLVTLDCPAYSVKKDTYVLVLPNEGACGVAGLTGSSVCR